MIFVNNASGQTIYHGPEWTALTGQALDRSLGMSWLDRIHIEDRALVEDTHCRAMMSASAYAIQYRLLRADDSASWVCVGAQPSFGPIDRSFTGVLGSLEILPERGSGRRKPYGQIHRPVSTSSHLSTTSTNALRAFDETWNAVHCRGDGTPDAVQRILNAIMHCHRARTQLDDLAGRHTSVLLDMALIDLTRKLAKTTRAS